MSKLSTLLKTGARLDAAYIQSGVLAGPFYTSSEVSGGLPKPKYLQSAQNTNVLTIKTDSDNPLIVRFALGTNAGGAWQGATRTLYSDMTISLTATSLIVLQLDDPADTSLPVSVLALSPVPNITFSRTAPASPAGGDLWFSYDANWMKQYDAGTLSWENKNWTILGEVGVGADGYIYSMRSDYPHRELAEALDTIYNNDENPWRHYDGVSFLTDGQYAAQRSSQWAGDQSIVDAVMANSTAYNAIINSQSGAEGIATNTSIWDTVNYTYLFDLLVNKQTANGLFLGATPTILQDFFGPKFSLSGSTTVSYDSTQSHIPDDGYIFFTALGDGTTCDLNWQVDLTGVNFLNLDWNDRGDSFAPGYIHINGTNVYSNNYHFNPDYRRTTSIDVSAYSGVCTIRFRSIGYTRNGQLRGHAFSIWGIWFT